MKDECAKRRLAAVEALIVAALDIADAHGICPICLFTVTFNSMRENLEGGRIAHLIHRHEGDEGLEGITVQ